MLLDRLKLLFVAVAGAGAAIPGISALADVEIPARAGPLFRFMLVVSSSLAVLVGYSYRGRIWRLSNCKASLLGVACIILVYVLFLINVSIASKVLVPYHRAGGISNQQFVPLFLGDSADLMIDSVGSRSQLLAQRGGDYLDPFFTETNVAATLEVMITGYALLVALLSITFTTLGLRVMTDESPQQSTKAAGST